MNKEFRSFVIKDKGEFLKMKKWYYIIFIACLYFFNGAFNEYIVMHGLIQGLIIGLIIAFLCKFIFNMVTKTIVFVAVVCALLAFLVSAGYIGLPIEIEELLSFGMFNVLK